MKVLAHLQGQNTCVDIPGQWPHDTAPREARTLGSSLDSDTVDGNAVAAISLQEDYSAIPRNRNPANGNHLGICLSSPQKNGN